MKYEKLLRGYDVLCFSIGVKIKTFKKENPKLDSLVGELEISNDAIEKYYNEFINYFVIFVTNHNFFITTYVTLISKTKSR